MENEILKEILAELKGHSVILKEHSVILQEHTKELKDIKKAVRTLERDVVEIKDTINKYVYADIAKLGKKSRSTRDESGLE